jgi:hypothetical protein
MAIDFRWREFKNPLVREGGADGRLHPRQTREGGRTMWLRRILVIGGVLGLLGTGVAIADHVSEVDPATVPEGFLVTHNAVTDVQISSFARAVKRHGADVFVQHVQFEPGEATDWHTHPGPVLVTIVRGSLIYEDSHGNMCRQTEYGEKTGFMDPGFGHVHRGIGGETGVDFYAVYVLPSGSENHLILADPPEECT